MLRLSGDLPLRGKLIAYLLATTIAASFVPQIVFAETPIRPGDTGIVTTTPPPEAHEDKLDRLTRAAEAALGKCDMGAFFHAQSEMMGELAIIIRKLRNASGQAFNEALVLGIDNRKFYKEHLAKWVKYLHAVTAWQYIPGSSCQQTPRHALFVPSPTGNGEADSKVALTLETGAVSRRMTGHVQRLARDIGGGVVRFDFGNEEQDGTGQNIAVGARFTLGPPTQFFKNPLFLYVAFSHDWANGTASGTAAGPFNMPGLGVGANPNGFFTASTSPVSHQYDFQYRRQVVEVSLATEFNSGPIEFYPWAGVRIGRTTVNDNYRFDRPAGAAITGNYTTDSHVNSFGGFIGLTMTLEPTGSSWSVSTQGRVGFDVNSAKSDVAFNLTSPLLESQSVSISDHKTTPYLYGDIGVKRSVGPWNASLTGSIEYGGYAPNVAIPGGGVSPTLGGETSTIYGVRGRFTYKFPSR